MIEVYVGTSESVELRIHAGGTRVNSVSAVIGTLYADGVELSQAPASVVEPAASGETHEYYTYPVELAATATERKLKLVWSYEPTVGVAATRTDFISVVQPYVQVEQAQQEFPLLKGRTYEQLRHIERVVRYTINAFCGQSFGLESGKTYYVRGSGSSSLWLPRRLVTLAGVVGTHGPMTTMLRVSHDNWSVGFLQPNAGYRDVKADIGLVSHPHYRFETDSEYACTGDWGWEYVPGEIQQAASLLMGRHEEPEQNWRSYNTSVVRANDWRMEFNKNSTQTTGSAEADLMLQDYKAPGIGVI